MKNKTDITVSQWVYLVSAMLLLAVPLRWLLAAAISGTVHELCHVAAIRVSGYRILGIDIGVRGAMIRTSPMESRRELLCAAAGPIGGLLLVQLMRWVPCIAICALVQSIFNLLPVYPADGGRILACCRKMFRERKMQK